MPESSEGSHGLESFGLWLEQLLAESTGKENTGILPINGEPMGTLVQYADDRVFVYFALKDRIDADVQNKVNDLARAGHPVITIELKDEYDIGREFLRWEISTAAAGAILGINPFDQPDVQESKANTNRLLQQIRDKGRLREEAPTFTHGPLRIFSDLKADNVRTLLSEFLDQAGLGDYIAIQVFLTENPETDRALDQMRLRIRNQLKLATTVGYGPRYLHSTGQYHKGGPNAGIFLQLTGRSAHDIQIPNQPYTFDTFKLTQAAGDIEALKKRGRRVLRVDMTTDVEKGLRVLSGEIEVILSEKKIPVGMRRK